MSSPAAPPPEVPPLPPSLWTELWARRVPQFLGLYVGGATSAVLFVEFLVARYALSPYLVDALLLAIVLALPAVAVLAYAHGAPGSQRWTRSQGAVLSCNGLVVVAALGLTFWGEPFGPTTETVTVETADGETVERTVATAAFRKRLVVSSFEGALGRVVTQGLAADLNQDLFITAYGPGALRRSLREAGFEDPADAPLALLRDATDEVLAQALVTGAVETTDRGYRLAATLHELGTRGRPTEYALEGPDLLRLVDDLSVRVRDDLGLPEVLADQSEDLALEDLFTASLPAFEAFADALHARDFAQDEAAAAALLDQAVERDSTFAQAHVVRYASLQTMGRAPEAQRALDAAQRHRYRLPEADRFWLSAVRAFYAQRPDDALAAAREWTALYPDDVRGFQMLVGLLRSRDEMDEAIEAQRVVARLDAENPNAYLQLADVLYAEERYDEAFAEVETFRQRRPDDTAGLVWVGIIERARGNADAALTAIRQASVLDPEDARISYRLADQLARLGEWDEAEAMYLAALRRAAEPADRSAALSALAHHHEIRGEHEAMVARLDEMWAVRGGYLPPVQVLVQQLGEGYHYTQAGRTDVFEDVLNRALAQPELEGNPQYQAHISSAAAYAYALTGRTDEVLRYAAVTDSLYRSFGTTSGIAWVNALRGMGLANRGDYARAAQLLRPHVQDSPLDMYRGVRLAEIYLAAGNAAEARAVAERVLVSFPAQPGAHLVLAKLSHGRPAEARRHLDAALAAWSDADPGFEPAREARALRQRLAG